MAPHLDSLYIRPRERCQGKKVSSGVRELISTTSQRGNGGLALIVDVGEAKRAHVTIDWPSGIRQRIIAARVDGGRTCLEATEARGPRWWRNPSAIERTVGRRMDRFGNAVSPVMKAEADHITGIGWLATRKEDVSHMDHELTAVLIIWRRFKLIAHGE
jgi:hypothetical protein